MSDYDKSVQYLRIELASTGRHPRLPEFEELALAITEEVNAGVRNWRIIEIKRSSNPADAERSGRRDGLRSSYHDAIREFGTPPPGEGTHPLQEHRDSMG